MKNYYILFILTFFLTACDSGGNHTPTTESNPIIQSVDNDDGSKTDHYEDGTKITIYPDGTRLQENVDGSSTQNNPDGSSIEVNIEGETKTTLNDGTYSILNSQKDQEVYYSEDDTLIQTKDFFPVLSMYTITPADNSIIEVFNENNNEKIGVKTYLSNSSEAYRITNLSGNIVSEYAEDNLLESIQSINNDNSYEKEYFSNDKRIEYYDISGYLEKTRRYNEDDSYNETSNDNLTVSHYDYLGQIKKVIVDNEDGSKTETEYNDSGTISDIVIISENNTKEDYYDITGTTKEYTKNYNEEGILLSVEYHMGDIRVEYFNEDGDLIETKREISGGFYILTSPDETIIKTYDNSDNLLKTKTISSDNSYTIIEESNPSLISYYNSLDLLEKTKLTSVSEIIEKIYNNEGDIINTKTINLSNGYYSNQNADLSETEYYDNNHFKYKTLFEHFSGLSITVDYNLDGTRIENTKTPDGSGGFNTVIVEYDSNNNVVSTTEEGFVVEISGDGLIKTFYIENTPNDNSDDVLFKQEINNGDGTNTIIFFRPDGTKSVVVNLNSDGSYIQTHYDTDETTILILKTVEVNGDYSVKDGDIITYYTNDTLQTTETYHSDGKINTIEYHIDNKRIEYYDNDENLFETKVFEENGDYTLTSSDGHTIKHYDLNNDLVKTKNINNDNSYNIVEVSNPNLILYYDQNDILLNSILTEVNNITEISYNSDGSVHYTKITDRTNDYYTIENTDGSQIDYYNNADFKYQNIFTHFSGLKITTVYNIDGTRKETTETPDGSGGFNTVIINYDSNGAETSRSEDGFVVVDSGSVKEFYIENTPNDNSDDVLFKTEEIISDNIREIIFYRPDGYKSVVVQVALLGSSKEEGSYVQTNYDTDGITILSIKTVAANGQYTIEAGNVITHYDDFDNIVKIVTDNGNGTNTEENFDEHGIKTSHIISANDNSYKNYYDTDTGLILQYRETYTLNKLIQTEYFIIDPRIEYYDNLEQLDYTLRYFQGDEFFPDNYYYTESNDNLTFVYYSDSDEKILKVVFDNTGGFTKTYYNPDGSYSITTNDIDFDNYDSNGVYVNSTSVDTNHDHESEHAVDKPYTIKVLSFVEVDGYSWYHDDFINDGYIDQGIGEVSSINLSTDEFVITGHSENNYHWYLRDEDLDDKYNDIQILAFDGTNYSVFQVYQSYYNGLDQVSEYDAYSNVNASYIEHDSERYADYEQAELQYNLFEPVSFAFNDTTTLNITENTNTGFKTLGTDINGLVMDVSNHVNFQTDNHNIHYSFGTITAYSDLGLTIADVYYEDTYIDTLNITTVEYKSYCLSDSAVGTGYARLSVANREEFVTCGYINRGHGEIINSGSHNHYAFRMDKQYRYPDSDNKYYDYYVKDNGDGTYLVVAYNYVIPGYGLYKVLDDPSSFQASRVDHYANPWVLNRVETDLGSHININLEENGYVYLEP